MMKTAALETFISDWKSLEREHAPIDSLESFINEWKDLENAAALPEFIKTFSALKSEMLKSGNFVDLFGIYDIIKRDEKAHTAYLAWLLDAQADHGQGDIFLREFLKRVQSDFLENLKENDTYVVKTEDQVNENIRFDISLKRKDFIIVIEAKIDAHETNNQLTRYAEYLQREKIKGKKTLLLYLTINGETGSTDEAVPVTWRKVAEALSQGVKLIGERNPEFEKSLAFQVITQFRDRIENL